MGPWSSPDAQRMWRLGLRYTSLGIEMAAAVTIGTLGGRWLDGKLGTEPYLFWFGVVVGIGAATRAVLRVVRSAQRDQRHADAAERPRDQSKDN